MELKGMDYAAAVSRSDSNDTYQSPINKNKTNERKQNKEAKDTFEEKRRISNRKKILRIGTGKPEDKGGFNGPDKKAWFFISRVSPHVTEDMIEEYIRKKEGFENQEVEVKYLQFKRKKGELKSFLVKVSFDKKDELYKTEFWPKNVSIRRFSFNAYNKNRPENDFLQ